VCLTYCWWVNHHLHLSWKITDLQDNIMNQSNKTRSNSKHLQKKHMAFVNHMFDLLLTGQPTLTLLTWKMRNLQYNIMHQNNPKKDKFQKCTKNNVTFVNYMFDPLLVAKLSTTLINERWQTYKDNILHQSNKNCLLIKW